MERANSEDGNGGIKLPIGFRFHPTDQELLLHYLKRKVYSLPLPARVIPELDVFQSNPWDLPGDLEETRYFFSQKKRNIVNKCGNCFSAGCGYWKSTGKDRQIVAPGSNLVIGIKKSLVFCKGKNSSGRKTQWIMHQFYLGGPVITPYLSQKLMIQVGDWIVCRVYQRTRRARNIGTVTQQVNSKKSRNLRGIRLSDHMNLRMGNNTEMGFSVSQASSSSSSAITEISSNDLDQEACSGTY